MGTEVFRGVYRATRREERPVAVKRVPVSPNTREDRIALADREIENQQDLNRKNARVTYFEDKYYGKDALYFAYELCDMSLAQLLELGMPSLAERMSLCQGLVDSLKTIHDAGIVHMDIKEENVLVKVNSRGEREVKLTDMQLSMRVDIQANENFTMQTITTKGLQISVMAPEMLLRGRSQSRTTGGGQELTSAVDIWLTGHVMYHTLTGHYSPFMAPGKSRVAGSDHEHQMRKLATQTAVIEGDLKPAALGLLLQRLPPRWGMAAVHLLRQMLAPSPAARPGIGAVGAHPLFWLDADVGESAKDLYSRVGRDGDEKVAPAIAAVFDASQLESLRHWRARAAAPLVVHMERPRGRIIDAYGDGFMELLRLVRLQSSARKL